MCPASHFFFLLTLKFNPPQNQTRFSTDDCLILVHVIPSTWNVISPLMYSANLSHYSKPHCSFKTTYKAHILYIESRMWYTHVQIYSENIYDWFYKKKHFQLFPFTLNYIFPIILNPFQSYYFFYIILNFLMFTNSFLINWLYVFFCLQEISFMGSPLFRKFYRQGYNLWNREIILEKNWIDF